MKREEKNEQSRNQILESAIREFARKSYTEASVNDICANGAISKGRLYYHFKDKDELYLECVGICFDTMAEFMADGMREKKNAKGIIEEYMRVRHMFFEEHPDFQNIFFFVMFQCPAHLKDRVKEREGKFQAFNRRHFYNILSHTKLRDGVGQEQAMEYFRIFQEMFNGYHRRYLERGEEI